MHIPSFLLSLISAFYSALPTFLFKKFLQSPYHCALISWRAASELRGAASGGAARKGGVGGERRGGLRLKGRRRGRRGNQGVKRWRDGGMEGLARNLRRETGSAQPISGHRGPSIMLRVRGQPTSPLLVTSWTITFAQLVWWFRLDPQVTVRPPVHLQYPMNVLPCTLGFPANQGGGGASGPLYYAWSGSCCEAGPGRRQTMLQ